ncbi:MAG: hypothetical protein JNK87_30580 [Bryobacterales bacterium]|nr:hypothetical protein [Bryobacterales bacterium]
MRLTTLLFAVSYCALLSAQDFGNILATASRQSDRNARVTAVRLRCYPQDCRVRPLENMVLQAVVEGEVMVSGSSDPRKGRIRRPPGPAKVLEADGGFVTKPFKFQGSEGNQAENFVDGSGTFGSIFGKVTQDYLLQDSFVYAAPEKAGEYTVESVTEGIKATVKIKVDPTAPSTKVIEEYTFPAESHGDEPYRALAEKWAPVFAQETWWDPKADMLARFDLDNDWIGDNNWDNAPKGSSQAYIYYQVFETATHWFVIYNGFHPRDYSDKCLIGSCHENDNEGMILTIQRDGSEFGKLVVMQTLAHDVIHNYTNERGVRPGVHSVAGSIEFQDGRPVVFIEAGGHGMYGTTSGQYARYNLAGDAFTLGTGITYVYKGAAERPKHLNDRKVGYDLLPMLSHWWARAGSDQNQRMFDVYQPYAPVGGRPGAALARMGTTFYGRKEAANKAKPFWGWHDNKTLKAKELAVGQWGLDPAYALTRMLKLPAEMPVALDYTYNPYLGVGAVAAASAPPQVMTTAPAVTTTPTAPAAGGNTTAQVQGVLPTTLPGGTAPVAQPSQPVQEQPQPASGGVLPTLGGTAAPAATTTPTAPAQAPVAAGWVDVEASVDGSVIFHVTPGGVTVEVLSGGPVAQQKVEQSGAMPVSASGLKFRVEKKLGRGTVKQVETAAGDIATIRVDDSKKGADRHQFRLHWNP